MLPGYLIKSSGLSPAWCIVCVCVCVCVFQQDNNICHVETSRNSGIALSNELNDIGDTAKTDEPT